MVKVTINNLPAKDLTLMGTVPISQKGQAGGVATLGTDGKVPLEQLPPIENASLPTLEEIGAEPAGAELRAKQYTDEEISSIAFPPPPTLADLGGEPAGAEARAKQYTDEEISSIAFPPPPTLADLGGEPAGAEVRSRQYTDQKFGGISFPPPPTLADLGGEPAGAEVRSRQYTDQKFGGISFPPPPTLADLGGEPAGAELRAKSYTAQEVAALISRIQVLERRHATRINCGNGPQYYGAEGLWQADIYFPSSGTAVVNVAASFPSNPPASGYSDPWVLNTMRFASTFEYSIPCPNGSHSVDLLFCEPYFSNPGEKIFNVFLQGQQVLTNFDILATAKKMEAVIKTFSNVVVSNNRLIVRFTSVKDQASISGIIIRYGS